MKLLRSVDRVTHQVVLKSACLTLQETPGRLSVLCDVR